MPRHHQSHSAVQRNSHRWVHVHCSTPCSSGSPLKNLTQQVDETEADREWLGIMTSVEPYLNFGDSRSFELPKRNQIWNRPQTKGVLERCGLRLQMVQDHGLDLNIPLEVQPAILCHSPRFWMIKILY